MASGLWTSVSGATAQQVQVDSIANNLANADTLGFKKDLPTFKEYLAAEERDHPGGAIPHGQIKDKDLYPIDGRDQSFVVVDGTYTDFKQGHLRVTQSPLDVAIDGPGLLEVSTPQGIRYTRQGSLKMATDGRLVTTEGFPVLTAQPGGLAQRQLAATGAGQGASAAVADAGRFINLRDRRGQVTINQQGDIYAGDELLGRLSLVEFQNLNGLRKQGSGLYENQNPTNQAQAAVRTQVHQGMVETSNVNPIEEMTNLIKANRLFESDMKALKTYGDMMGREANDLGKL